MKRPRFSLKRGRLSKNIELLRSLPPLHQATHHV